MDTTRVQLKKNTIFWKKGQAITIGCFLQNMDAIFRLER